MAPQKRRLRHPQHPQRHRLAVALQARHAVEHELGAAQGGAAQNFRRGIDAPVARSAGNRLQRIRNTGAIRRGLQERLGPLAKILVVRCAAKEPPSHVDVASKNRSERLHARNCGRRFVVARGDLAGTRVQVREALARTDISRLQLDGMRDQRPCRFESTGVHEQAAGAFQRGSTVRVERERAIELFAGGSPIAAVACALTQALRVPQRFHRPPPPCARHCSSPIA